MLKKAQLALSPADLRRQILTMAFHGSSVHIACAFSLVEVLSVLYSRLLQYNPQNVSDPDRDVLILSKGHGIMALYAVHAKLGWLSEEKFRAYFSDGSDLHGLCEFKTPGLEVASGSLGHGLPIAVGMALGLKRRGRTQKVVCIVGDGEMNEGPMWEALLFAGHHKLDNLLIIVDANGFQAMGQVTEILNMEPFVEKFRSFGFAAAECDGHSMDVLEKSLADLWTTPGLPQALVARTVKGHGVSFMKNENKWHYSRLTPELFQAALSELDGDIL
jgi:transketolase